MNPLVPQDAFGPFGDRIWLNCAHQGPLPRAAANEAREAIGWKMSPHRLRSELFRDVPARLKRALGRLIGAPPEEIILGNSASYGLHLLANGIPWRAGDEVLVVRGDFPSDILPWLGLRDRAVTVRELRPRRPVPDAAELEASLGPSTRLFCTTWVHSFSGWTADIATLGEVCAAHGVTFVVNVSQALGARPLDVSSLAVDAVVGVGFKWLCGPYGTGFCWIRPELLRELEHNRAYWLALLTEDDLAREELSLEAVGRAPPTARTYDVFGTANFFNFKPWAASIEFLLETGIEEIAEYDQMLVSRFARSLDRDKYVLLSPEEPRIRSTLLLVSCKDPDRNAATHERLTDAGIDVALRQGRLRFSPHLYNSEVEIDRCLDVLARA